MPSPTVLEYARFHNLTIQANPRHPLNQLKDIASLQIGSEGESTSFEPPHDQIQLQDDKLQVCAGAGSLLAKCMTDFKMSSDSLLMDHKRSRMLLRLDMPLLRCDHWKDMKWFRKGTDLNKILRACAEDRFTQATTGGDGTDILDQCRTSAQATEKLIASERLETTKDVVMALSNYLIDRWSSEENTEFLEHVLGHTLIHAVQPPTPLLTPALQSYEPDVCLPSIPQFDLDAKWQTLPDHLIFEEDEKQELRDESPIKTSDVVEASPEAVRSLMTAATTTLPCDKSQPLDLQSEPTSSYKVSPTMTERGDLKVETPLMPSPDGSVRKPCTSVAFEDVLVKYIDDRPSEIWRQGESLQEDLIDDALATAFENSQLSVIDGITKEPPGLNEKTLRLDNPNLQCVEIRPPQVSQSFDQCLAIYLNRVQIPPLLGQTREEKTLNWIFIPKRLTELNLREDLDEGDFDAQVIRRPENIIKSHQLLWKEAGLRVLDTDEDQDEELQADTALISVMQSAGQSHIPSKRQIQAELLPMPAVKLAKHSASRIDNELTSTPVPSSTEEVLTAEQVQPLLPYPTVELSSRRRIEELMSSSAWKAKIPAFSASSGPNAGSDSLVKGCPPRAPQPFSATSSLSSFLDLRGDRFKKVATNDLSSRTPEVANDPIQVSQSAKIDIRRGCYQMIQVPSTPGYSATLLRAPCPQLTMLREPRTIIADETLTKTRALVKLFDQHADSNLTTIYRDLKGLPSMILNPTTCLLLTNVQALAQRSLPGTREDDGKPTVQSRVRALASDYKLILALATVSANLTGSALQAQMSHMAVFASFCASLGSSQGSGKVCPVWIPVNDRPRDHSQSDPVCAWIWRSIDQHAFYNNLRIHHGYLRQRTSIEELIFIQDTTVWELFLRKCGMNPMAAQVVLGMLKKPEEVEKTSGNGKAEFDSPPQKTHFGLRQFVKMSQAERSELFEDRVGAICLKKIAKVLDSKWPDII